jgi:hypothetical protein
MAWRILTILFLGQALSWLPSFDQPRQGFSPPSYAVQKRANLLRFDFASRENAGLLTAYAAGARSGLTKRLRDAHQDLKLQHLFTPSGLHFTALLLWLAPVFYLYRKNQHPLLFGALFILFLSPWLLDGFYSLKRVGALKSVLLVNAHLRLGLKPYWVFLMVFFVDFLFGTYQYSPQSFQLSFLFLGLIFSVIGSPKLFFTLALFIGQCFVSYQTGSPLSLTGFILGLMITALFSTIFPLLLSLFWLSPLFSSAPFEFMVEWKKNILLFVHPLSQMGPTIQVDSFIYGLLLFTLAGYAIKLRALTRLPLTMLILACPLAGPAQLNKVRIPEHYQVPRPGTGFHFSSWGARGLHGTTDDNQRCTYRLFGQSQWMSYCRPRN